jgi:hypothetical protein
MQGVILLMHLSGENDAEIGTKMAKKCRPIINPIGMLPELVERYARAREGGCFEGLLGEVEKNGKDAKTIKGKEKEKGKGIP